MLHTDVAAVSVMFSLHDAIPRLASRWIIVDDLALLGRVLLTDYETGL